jgi:hypothetical protein
MVVVCLQLRWDRQPSFEALANALRAQPVREMTMNPSRRWTAAVLLIVSSVLARHADAQTPPARHGDIPLSMRGFLGIELNRDSLASVVARLGPAKEWRTGDASGAEVWRCYRTGNDSEHAVLLISSGGEMGGSGSQVDEIRLSRSPRADSLIGRCGKAASSPGLATPGGLGLGISRATVVHLLGIPLVQGADSITYEWAGQEVLPTTDPNYSYWNARRKECFGGKAPYIDVASGVVVRFDQRGVVEIHLSRYDESMC